MISATPRNTPRLANLMDLGGIALLAIGGGCYARAWFGLEALRANTGARPAGGLSALATYERLTQLSRFGLWVCAAAGVVLVASAAVAWHARRSAPASPSEPAPAAV